MQKIEHEIQAQCIRWYKSNFPNGVIFAVPNAGKRNAATMQFLIAEGFTAGAPDLVAMRSDGKIIFIEMKAPNGRLRTGQIEFKEKCDYIDEDLYFVARSLDEFKMIIDYGSN